MHLNTEAKKIHEIFSRISKSFLLEGFDVPCSIFRDAVLVAVLAQFQRCPGVWKCTDASRHQHLLCHDCQRPGHLHFLSPVQQEEGETVNGEHKTLSFRPWLTPGLLLSPSAFFPFSVPFVVSSFCLHSFFLPLSYI